VDVLLRLGVERVVLCCSDVDGRGLFKPDDFLELSSAVGLVRRDVFELDFGDFRFFSR